MSTMIKLDSVLEGIQETQALLRRLVACLGPQLDTDNVLPYPMATDDELQEFSQKLSDDIDFRKKVVSTNTNIDKLAFENDLNEYCNK